MDQYEDSCGTSWLRTHNWVDSYREIGLVGNLYGNIYPYVCKHCGALKKYDDVVIEPDKINE